MCKWHKKLFISYYSIWYICHNSVFINTDVARVVMDKCMIIKKGNKFEFLDDTKESVSGTDKTNAQNEPE